jgi:hypothetical protein
VNGGPLYPLSGPVVDVAGSPVYSLGIAALQAVSFNSSPDCDAQALSEDGKHAIARMRRAHGWQPEVQRPYRSSWTCALRRSFGGRSHGVLLGKSGSWKRWPPV